MALTAERLLGTVESFGNTGLGFWQKWTEARALRDQYKRDRRAEAAQSILRNDAEEARARAENNKMMVNSIIGWFGVAASFAAVIGVLFAILKR